jgi:rubrerythrin
MGELGETPRYLSNRQKEIDGAAMYRALGEAERQPQMAKVYRKLADTEEHHALAWEKRLSKLKVRSRRGGHPGAYGS